MFIKIKVIILKRYIIKQNTKLFLSKKKYFFTGIKHKSYKCIYNTTHLKELQFKI
jgi:hypothetical protein